MVELNEVNEWLRREYRAWKQNPKTGTNWLGAAVSGPREKVFYTLIRKAVEKGATSAIEIGTFRGATALRMRALGLTDIVTINPVKAQVQDAIRLMEHWGVNEEVDCVCADSLEFLLQDMDDDEVDGKRYDVAFIDGRHTFAYVMAETFALIHRVRHLIIWDDIDKTSGVAEKAGVRDLCCFADLMRHTYGDQFEQFHSKDRRNNLGWMWLSS
jgi:predicted O-methyltransferase YrrM